MSFLASTWAIAYQLMQQGKIQTIHIGAARRVRPIDLQRFTHRECIIRRYQSEKVLDKYVWWVKKTKEITNSSSFRSVDELEERLLRDRGVKVRDTLEIINNRTVRPVVVQKKPLSI